MPRYISPADLPALLRPGMRVYAPGLGGESAVLVEALRAQPEACAGVHFIGVWLPGTNRVDYAGLAPDARASAIFITREMTASFAAGRVDFRPLSYFQTYQWLAGQPRIDVALLQTAPPDAEGCLSLGICNDFAAAILGRAGIVVAHVNPRMPRTEGALRVPLADVDYLVEEEAPLLGDDDAADATFDAIGRHIAALVRDGDTLEVGIGRVQRVFCALNGARALKVHAGAITTPLLQLVAAGRIADTPGAITTGVALGDAAFYRFVATDPRVRFAPVGWTHSLGTLAGIERFVAVNSVIEVDLLGQANAEMIGGRQLGGAGGLIDFMRGARASPGGRAIVALPATAKGGRVSKIVPFLPEGVSVSVARGDMDAVVTEYGVAELRDTAVDARAQALIAIAAPQFQEELSRQWADRRRRM